MSVNKYDSTTGTLTSLASGARTWIGTKAAYDAEKQAGTLPTNCLVVITDDEVAMDTVPTEGSPVAVTSDGIYNELYTLRPIASVDGDGVMMRKQALNSLYTNLHTYVGDDMAKFLKTNFIIKDNNNVLVEYHPIRIEKNSAYFYSLTQLLSTTNCSLSTFKIASTVENCGQFNNSYNGSTWTIRDIGPDTLASGLTWSVEAL